MCFFFPDVPSTLYFKRVTPLHINIFFKGRCNSLAISVYISFCRWRMELASKTLRPWPSGLLTSTKRHFVSLTSSIRHWSCWQVLGVWYTLSVARMTISCQSIPIWLILLTPPMTMVWLKVLLSYHIPKFYLCFLLISTYCNLK